MAPIVIGQSTLADRPLIESDGPSDGNRLVTEHRTAEELDGMRRAERAGNGIGQAVPFGQSAEARVLVEPSGIGVPAMQTGTHRARGAARANETGDLHRVFAEHDLTVVDLPIIEPHRRMQIGDEVGSRDHQRR